ncbi:TATA element modulatory factor [Spea bombifrons]|uniref:TATA element modulatory factor n=1 Tax=Spea bombifrons TaxID=233779 RepID=UPI002349B591|nr:TATA element modulatory factor [Spea bombifrons]
MSWFNASQLSSFAKQALSQAQKSIDRVLDIKEDESAWADSIIRPQDDGSGPSIKGSWENSNWGANSDDPQTQVLLSPTAITKPLRRTVVDESENFFSAFLSSPEPNPVMSSSVVSKAPTKSPRLKEEVKRASPSLPFQVQQDNDINLQPPIDNQGTNVTQSQDLPDVSQEISPPDIPETSAEEKCDVEYMDSSPEDSSGHLKDHAVLESKPEAESTSPSPAPSTENKDLSLDTKMQKPEDRQTNTPSPPISTFSSGTSTTSDIEVLDHESVISESSVSSRQEVSDSKTSLHLMQTSFQLLSPSSEYGRLDDFPKLTESCSSSDAFERIDSFSVQSLDSHSVSEINSDDELPGRQCTLVSIAVASTTPTSDVSTSMESKSDQGPNETLLAHSTDDVEMEESGRSATPVNSEQPDLLIVTPQIDDEAEEEAIGQGPPPISHVSILKPEVDYSAEEIQKMVEELTTRLEKRETQLLSVSKEKAFLEEAYDNLKDEMVRVKEECSSVSTLKDEFTHRIAEAERKAQLACKERDLAKKEVKVIKEELATRLNSSETAEIMREKDEQIQGLMEEGEKLSKQQLHNSNIIKKLRAKEKEHEQTGAKQAKKIRALEDELQLLKQTLDGKEELEKQHRDNIRKLNAVVERQEKDLGKLQTDLEEFQEKNRSLQSALDSSYRELAELHKANATKASKAQEAALSCEIKVKEEMYLAVEKAKEESQKQQEALAIQVADLRMALQRAEQQSARKEDYLRQEIAELQQRLQEGESRSQELSQSVTSATRPLLRQIENLQATLAAQTSSWEKLEKNLSDRLTESQTLLASAVEKERACTEELLAVKTQVSAVESQNSLLRQEKSRFQAQLEAEKARLSKLEEEHSRNQVELENLMTEYKKTVEEARKEKTLLTSQLEMEKMRVEQEKKKAMAAVEAAKEKERKLYGFPSAEAGTATPTLSRSSSISGADFSGLQTSFISQEDPHEHSYGPMTMSVSGSNTYDAVRMGAGSSVMENLQSQLKLREGEITQLQMEIGSLEKTRSILAEEVVKLNNLNDDLMEKVKEIPKLRVQMRDLDQRYNTILQMYGEKAEEAEELKLDLEDVKVMYKTQIDELLKQRLN